MKVNVTKSLIAVILTGCFSAGNANEVCKILPGSVTCGSGTVNGLAGNGMVNVNGTVITGATTVNGLLSAEDASFFTLDVNGSTNLIQCTISSDAAIKGSLSASSSKFEGKMEVYSSSVRFINSKVSGDLHVLHTEPKKQTIYLDNFSEVSGDVIFDGGDGEVVVRGNSRIAGKVIGGHITVK